jgi:hypothetical protein
MLLRRPRRIGADPNMRCLALLLNCCIDILGVKKAVSVGSDSFLVASLTLLALMLHAITITFVHLSYVSSFFPMSFLRWFHNAHFKNTSLI